MRINTNVAALNSYNQLKNTQNNLSKSLSRLSSGKRINGAADDAAGLAISEKMNSQTKGLAMAQRNAQDGISMIQTAEGALKETHSILQRMRELSVQSANDTNTSDDRAEIQKEVDQLSQELTRIGETTEFNTQKLLDGSLDDTKFQIGANEGQNMEIAINDMRAEKLGVASSEGLQFETSSTVTATIANHAIEADSSYNVEELDEAADIGGTDYNYVMKDDNDQIYGVSTDGQTWKALDTNTDTANDGVTDLNNVVLTNATDFDMSDKVTSGEIEVTEASGNVTLTGTATAEFNEDSEGLSSGEYTVVNENHAFIDTGNYGLVDSNGDLSAVSGDGQAWNDLEGDALFTVSGKNAMTTAGKTFEVAGGGGIDVSSQEAADNAISTLDDAIANVSAERSKLGAVQNRLDHTINNLNTAEENLTAAESRISDVDMAKEMMNMSKQQILSQAGTAMMAQANQLPQGVLQLLG